jgi:hypothetical protein
MSNQTHNLHPTPAARVAMLIWEEEYRRQSGGSMDFWHGLDAVRKKRCEMVACALLKDIDEALTDLDCPEPLREEYWSSFDLGVAHAKMLIAGKMMTTEST